mgnify:FL=1
MKNPHHVNLTCCKCHEVESFSVESDDYYAWRNGTPIQEVLGYLTVNQREILVTSKNGFPICGDCFDGMFQR